jgi:hypothetical protein
MGSEPNRPDLAAPPNRYGVALHDGELGWEVRILDPGGSAVWTQPCAGEAEARTLASTVQQHVYWLSPEKFREYYRLSEAG